MDYLNLIKRMSQPNNKFALYIYYRVLRARWDADIIVALSLSEFFNRNYYLHHNPDVALSGLDPIIHYVDYGAREERNPSPFFETSYYLANNPDVSETGMNPLLHFIRHGCREGRWPRSRYGVDPKNPAYIKPLVSRYDAQIVTTPPRTGRFVVFTAVTGGYDTLRSPEFHPPDCDFIAFSDRPLSVAGWRVLPLNYLHPDNTRAARFIKLHPHLYFSEYTHSIWLDANIGVRGDVGQFIDRLAPDSFIALFSHPLRDCIYLEGQQCILQNRDDNATIRWQLERYRADGFPRETGLWETGVLVRRHNDLRSVALMEAWWREIETGSRRDQLSLPVVAQRMAAELALLDTPGTSARVHPLLTFVSHLREPLPVEAAVFEAPQRMVDIEQISVTIGVCVHNMRDVTRDCLESVIAARGAKDRIIIIDDGSDEPTASFLRTFTGLHPRVVLLRHDVSRGYTRSANDVLKKSDSQWTILLNSDTVLPAAALRKLINAGEQYDRLGIVGPLSNAAGWQSVPTLSDDEREFVINEIPRGLTINDMDKICEEVTTGPVPFVTTVNGFCFAIRREVIDAIGYLDEEAFPLGYGEEDDFCFRAADAGFACGIATDAYILHVKSASFTTARRRVLAEQGARVLRRKYSAERVGAAIATMRGNSRLANLRERIAKRQGEFRV